MTLEELKRRAQLAAQDLDDRYDIRSKLDRGAQAATDAVRKTGDLAASAFDSAKEQVQRIDSENRISERVSEQARRAAQKADEVWTNTGAKDTFGRAASEAKSTAGAVYDEARTYYESASGAAKTGSSAVRLPGSIVSAVQSGREWMKKNPGKAVVVTLSLMTGTRLGSAFSSLDVAVLGSGGAGSWLFHSAVVPWGMRKLAEKYEEYLRRQEELLKSGDLDEAKRSQVEFERNLAKYVGAPLLGAFSIGAGAALVSEAISGGVVTGFPVSLVLGGNPMLSSLWLFGNGLVCFHNGYKFFMMALADRDEVQRVVRDIKGLLPSSTY